MKKRYKDTVGKVYDHGQGWCKHCGRIVYGDIITMNGTEKMYCDKCKSEVKMICKLAPTTLD